ncbi:MAG: HU family DNA-binding protein [bacterium]
MNKTQLINQVCRQTNCSKYSATQIVNACFSAIKKNTKARGGVTIAGFGRFWCDESNARNAYRMSTGRAATASSKTSTTKNTKGTKGTTKMMKGKKQVCFKPATRW